MPHPPRPVPRTTPGTPGPRPARLAAALLAVWTPLACAAPAARPGPENAPPAAPAAPRLDAPPAPQPPPAPAPPAVPAPPALRRVVVLGASASHGFGIRAEIGVPVRLAEVVDAAIRGAHEPPLDVSNPFFFLDPEGFAEDLVERALAHEPTLVIAPDFLFWFGYGILPESARPRLLERGLALLDRFECPLLVGDLPYMPQAVGGMLLAAQLPEEATVELMNARVRAWCEERPHAALLPVADFAARLTSGAPVELAGGRLGGEDGAALLLPDRLHPTLLGAAGLVALALEELARTTDDVPRAGLLLDPEGLAARVLAAKGREAGEPSEPSDFGARRRGTGP